MFSRHKNVGLILYLMAIFCKRFRIANAQDVGCPEKTFNNSLGYYTWDQVNVTGDQLYISHGFRCLNEYKHYVTRTCESSGWVPKDEDIACSHSIAESVILNTCPPEYKPILGELSIIRMCVLISIDQPWNDTCLKSSSSRFTYNLEKIDEIMLNSHIDIADVWLPASKIWFTNTSFRIENPIQWNLAGMYGTDVLPNRYEIDDTFRNRNGCLKRNQNSGEYIVTDCADRYHHLCLYNPEEPTMNALSCKSFGYQTTRYSTFQDVCIGIKTFASLSADSVNDDYVKEEICDNGNVFTIDSGHTLHIFRELAHDAELRDHRCLFQIIPDKITVTKTDWELDSNKVQFVNWAIETTFEDEPDTILAIRSNGEWEWANDVNCAICFIENVIQTPTMNFDALHEEKELFLRVQHVEFLWRDDNAYASVGFSCFTIIYDTKNVSRIEQVYFTPESTIDSETLYKLFTNGEGWYWCSGLEIRTFENITVGIRLGLLKFAILAPITSLQSILDIFTTDQLQPHILTHHMSMEQPDMSNYIFQVNLYINTPEYLTFEENRLNLSEPMLAAYYVQQKLYNVTADVPSISLNSTQYCLPSSISQLEEINFSGCRLGHYTTSLELCLLPTQLPITKKCIGDSIYGAVWMNEDIPKPNCKNELQSDVTQELHDLITWNGNDDSIVSSMIDIVLDTCPHCLIGADIFYISQFMNAFENSNSTLYQDNTLLLSVLQLYDRLLLINDTAANNAASLNATNVLLYSLDVILTNVTMSNAQIGIRNVIQPMLASFVFYTNETDVTGVAMIGNGNESDFQWNENSIRYLYRNETVADILNIPNLVIASYLPDILLSSFANAELSITMTFFMNDVLFQINNAHSPIETLKPSIQSNGKIVSVILPTETRNLRHILPIFIRPGIGKFSKDMCGYWDYLNNIDGWSTNGCMRNDDITTPTGIVLCEYRLEIVTIIGCSFSLVGIFFIFLTAILFKKWRKSSSSKVVLQFSITIGFEMGMVLFVNTEENTKTFELKNETWACTVLGVLTHYFVVATFFWMLIIGYMQLMRYVVVFHTFTSHFVIKSSLLAWGLPIIIIVLVLSLNPRAYLPNENHFDNQICYPSGHALYFGVMAPVALITLANLLIFLLVVKSLVMKKNDVRSHHHNKSMVLSQLRLSVFLFFSLGLTWIFAFLSMTETRLIFSYLFCFTATLQGFILFFYFILLDPKSRRLWKNWILNKLSSCIDYNK